MALKLPKEMWVAYGQSDNTECGQLSYMAPLGEPGTARMQETGRSWARSGREWCPIEKMWFHSTETKEATFHNTPQEGFKIMKAVSRWSTSNKLWRVADPRGFVVEIYTGNMEEVVQNACIDHGVVTTKCVWGREGGRNVLIPVDTSEYIEATKNTAALDNKIDPRSLPAGALIRIIGDERDSIYLGAAYTARLPSYEASFKFTTIKSKQFFFMKEGNTRIEARSSLKIQTVVNENYLSIPDNVKFINENLASGTYTLDIGYTEDTAIFVVENPTDLKTAKVVFTVASKESLELAMNGKDRFSKNLFLAFSSKTAGTYFINCGKGDVKSNYFTPHTLRFTTHHYSRSAGDAVKGICALSKPQLHQAPNGILTIDLSQINESGCFPAAHREQDTRQSWSYNSSHYFKIQDAHDWVVWVPKVCINDYEVSLFASA